MKWTEEEARRFFSDSPSWAGRRSSNWEPAQALIAALDQERARVVELGWALINIEMGCSFPEDDVQRAILKVARAALAAPEASDE